MVRLKKAIAKSPPCDRTLLPLCLCGSLKRAIACKIFSVRSLSSFSMFSAPLWFVKKTIACKIFSVRSHNSTK
ncbi:hypothetical protein [Nostoc sp.]|uniref:hypothetical protein n=1 Tax=Nostoc sp. TaxID=1180 RepID=UPI002FF6B223